MTPRKKHFSKPGREALTVGGFAKTVSGKDAAAEPIGIYSRRVLANSPTVRAAPKHSKTTIKNTPEIRE
ncbi:MAG: hypothetical protein KTR20_07000 [Cellvibrionaceae bacterium]|nr:hypothetical protein [Cellvibrionaceae bacterium]